MEFDGGVTPFPRKFPAAAGVIREGVRRGVLHGYTHCVLRDRLFRPRLFASNREFHGEFHDWLPAETHREHVARAQDILQAFFAVPVLTFVPPGNVFSRATLAAAVETGMRYVSGRDPGGAGRVDGLTWVTGGDVVAIHDRDLVVGGVDAFRRLLGGRPASPVTVREVGQGLEGRAR